MKELYVGKDGILIEFREHVLTDVIGESAHNLLTLEPVLHSKTDLPERRLKVVSTDLVRWTPENWRSVKANGRSADGKWAGIECRNNEIAWFGKNLYDAIELTPFDRGGNAGATVKIERPRGIGHKGVEINEGPRAGTVKVVSPILSDRIYAWVIVESGGKFRRREIAIRQPDQTVIIKDKEKRCVIAVFYESNIRRELLSWHNYNNGGLQENVNSPELFDDIRGYVEGNGASADPNHRFGEWIREWPSGAFRRLVALSKAALSLGIGKPYLEQALQRNTTITGLYRLTVLRMNGVEVGGFSDQAVARMNAGKFDQILRAEFPSLSAALDILTITRERRWACRNSSHPYLVEASNLAKGFGETALDQALDLVPIRVRVQDLMKELRPDSVLGNRGEKLLKDINGFFVRRLDPDTLRQSVNKFEAQVKEDAEREIDIDGPPPSNAKRFTEWGLARKRRRQWRSKLGQVIALCESGVWREPDVESSSADLMLAISAMTKPSVRPRAAADPKPENDLKAAIEWIIEAMGYENDSELKERGCRALREIVLPNSSVWWPLHEDIRRVRKLAEQYDQLARIAGVGVPGGDLNRRAGCAHLLIDLVEAMKNFVAGIKIEEPKTTTELLEIFSRPGHPEIKQAFEEAKWLKDYFQSSSYEDQGITLPEAAPMSPGAITLEGFKSWWRELASLFGILARLRSVRKTYSSQTIYYRQRRSADMQNYLKSSAPNPEFRRLYEKCFASGEDPHPKDFEELLLKWSPIDKESQGGTGIGT